MCEPLRGKERIWYEYGEHTDHESISTKCFNKSAVSSAIRFYIRYRVMPHLLEKEEPKIFSVWIKFARKNDLNPYYSEEEFQSFDFQCWLLDYCFGDVTE